MLLSLPTAAAAAATATVRCLPLPLVRPISRSLPAARPLRPMSWLGKLGFGGPRAAAAATDAASASSVAQGPDDDIPAPGQCFAQFGAGCFWGVELAFQRVHGVSKTEVGYTQGFADNPSYNDVCSGTTNHSEVVRVQYDPKECSYETLLDAFWDRHDPTTLNRQCGETGKAVSMFQVCIRETMLEHNTGLEYTSIHQSRKKLLGSQWKSDRSF